MFPYEALIKYTWVSGAILMGNLDHLKWVASYFGEKKIMEVVPTNTVILALKCGNLSIFQWMLQEKCMYFNLYSNFTLLGPKKSQNCCFFLPKKHVFR